jgi:hypothetical protein
MDRSGLRWNAAMRRISIMQSYFLPYAGYFRLMCDVDAFVMLSSVQFPKGGWVHRNRLRDDLGRLRWLTLPLAPMPLGTSIADVRYAEGAEATLADMARRFAACRAPRDHTAGLVERATSVSGAPVATIETLLSGTAAVLGLSVPFVREAELGLPSDLRGQERIFAICAALGANAYVNSMGGRDLYDPGEFVRRGLKLEFLAEYQGDPASILQRLHDSAPAEVLAEIHANLN